MCCIKSYHSFSGMLGYLLLESNWIRIHRKGGKNPTSFFFLEIFWPGWNPKPSYSDFRQILMKGYLLRRISLGAQILLSPSSLLPIPATIHSKLAFYCSDPSNSSKGQFADYDANDSQGTWPNQRLKLIPRFRIVLLLIFRSSSLLPSICYQQIWFATNFFFNFLSFYLLDVLLKNRQLEYMLIDSVHNSSRVYLYVACVN